MVNFRAFKEIKYLDGDLALLLRPLEEKDAKTIHDAVMASRDSLLPFMDWAHRESSVEGQLQRIQKARQDFAKGIEFNFFVSDLNTDEFLMSATLAPSRVPNKSSLSIGYWTSIKHSNKGLATVITKILIILAFDYLKCDRVEISCNKANKKSARVIEKCGFIFEGEARNYFIEPTIEMLQNGYYPDRTCMMYSLVPQDLKSMPWLEEINHKLIF